MVFCLWDCGNKTEQKQKSSVEMRDEFRDTVQKNFTNNFSNTINQESNQSCIVTTTQTIKINDLVVDGSGSKAEIGNENTIDMKCVLDKMSTMDFQSSLESSLKKALTQTIEAAQTNNFKGKSDSEMTLFGSGSTTNQNVETDTKVTSIVDKSVTETLRTDIHNTVTDKTFQDLKANINQLIDANKITVTGGGNLKLYNKAAATITGEFKNKFVANAVNTALATTDITDILDKRLKQFNDIGMDSKASGLGGLIESFGKAVSSVIGALSLNNPVFVIALGIVAVIIIVILKSLFSGGGSNNRNDNYDRAPRRGP